MNQRESDPREGWIRLMKAMDRLDRHLEEEGRVLETGDFRRLMPLRKKGKRLFDEALGFIGVCEDAPLPAEEFVAFQDALSKREKRIRMKMLRTLQRAQGLRDEMQMGVRTVRIGKTKMLQGYFRSGPSEHGYFIDRRIGK